MGEPRVHRPQSSRHLQIATKLSCEIVTRHNLRIQYERGLAPNQTALAAFRYILLIRKEQFLVKVLALRSKAPYTFTWASLL